MPPRDPFLVLGVPADASPAAIKAAWRRLARENHPDLADDPGAAHRATRRMAEINAAYEELRDPDRREARRRTTGAPRANADGHGRQAAGGVGADPAPGGPPRPRATRPVTGRLDTSDFFRHFHAVRHGSRGGTLPGHRPRDISEERPEPPRASEPTGPAHRRRGRSHAPVPPSLADARDLELAFGKFRGHTLGDVADFEPSYVDWIARTINRDPDLVAAARVIQADFDLRGVVRRSHAPTQAASPPRAVGDR